LPAAPRSSLTRRTRSGWLWAKHEWFLGRIGVVRGPSASRAVQPALKAHASLSAQRMLMLAVYYLIRYALGYVEARRRTRCARTPSL
jgi:hypothetical protein